MKTTGKKRVSKEEPKQKPTVRTPSSIGKPREDSKKIPAGVQRLLNEMMPYIEKCYPESRCCALIGLDWDVWNGYATRYPALRLAIKRSQAAKMALWQDTVEKGGPGWQAAMTLLERLDGENFSRSNTGRPVNTQSPYQAAMRAKRSKGKG